MNGFRKLQERLREEGWYLEWGLPCCQSCAWVEVEHDDLSKVLFNHEQDCEIEPEPPEFETEEEEDEWWENMEYEHNTPEQQGYSLFCFDGSKKGVKNLKQILPIIEECGCNYYWDKTGKSRIEISWEI